MTETKTILDALKTSYRAAAPTLRFVAVDPATMCHLREATADERTAYVDAACAQKYGPSFATPVLVGDVLIDEDRGWGQRPIFERERFAAVAS